jgi:hypothetical protein
MSSVDALGSLRHASDARLGTHSIDYQDRTENMIMGNNERIGDDNISRQEIEAIWRHAMRPETCKCGQHDGETES